MAYKSTFLPKNPQKCINIQKGEPVYCRSLWERALAKWCDLNSSVAKWGVEQVVIPYRCKTDGRIHRYFVDFYVQTIDKKVFLIEVKPKKQTEEPKKKKKVTKRYITEVYTWAKNLSKWETAEQYCLDRGWKFEIWTEEELRKLGLKIIT